MSIVGPPGAPLTHYNDGGGVKNFFGSESLAIQYFFGSMKDIGRIFLGHEKTCFFGGGMVIFMGSNQ